jgi:hypothetical protein
MAVFVGVVFYATLGVFLATLFRDRAAPLLVAAAIILAQVILSSLPLWSGNDLLQWVPRVLPGNALGALSRDSGTPVRQSGLVTRSQQAPCDREASRAPLDPGPSRSSLTASAVEVSVDRAYLMKRGYQPTLPHKERDFLLGGQLGSISATEREMGLIAPEAVLPGYLNGPWPFSLAVCLVWICALVMGSILLLGRSDVTD